MHDRSNFNPQVGDLVRVRQWDDMEDEFGTSGFGSIRCNFYFHDLMRALCGETFQIRSITDTLEVDIASYELIAINSSKKQVLEELLAGVYISKDMLEPLPDEEEKDEMNIEDSEVDEFLESYMRR